jgi:hypothetical protein
MWHGPLPFFWFSEIEFSGGEAIPVPARRAAIVFYPDAGAGEGQRYPEVREIRDNPAAEADSTEICPRPRV